MVRYTDITSPDINNGAGFRVTIWLSGCSHCCPGCHNGELWDYDKGKPLDDDKDLWLEIVNRTWHDYIDGITISGGDPLDRSDEDLEQLERFIRRFRKTFPTKTVWIYTGYDWEWLSDRQMDIVMLCDVLVDGSYIESQRDLSLAFRGSSNQRIFATDPTTGCLIDMTKRYDKEKLKCLNKLDDKRIEV